MKTMIVALMISLLTFISTDKSLKIILKDCHLPKLPKTAVIIGNEVVTVRGKKYGYLAFQGPADKIFNWIKTSPLTLTNKEEIFMKDLIVWPDKRPNWFKESSDKFMTADVYYLKRDEEKLLTLCWIDVSQKVIHLEYEVRE